MSRERKRAISKAVGSGYWRTEDAELVLGALEESHLSVAEFARKRGLSPARLLRWRKRLRHGERSHPSGTRSPEASTSLRFHAVRVLDGPVAPVPPGETEVELVLAGDRRIAVRRGFDAALLEEVVRLVESWPRC